MILAKSYVIPIIDSFDHLIFNKMVRFFKKILKHVAEYCEQAAIHGPQHIVSERLTILERFVVRMIIRELSKPQRSYT